MYNQTTVYKDGRHDISQKRSQNILITSWWLGAVQVTNPASSLLADGTRAKLKSKCLLILLK